MSKAPEASPLKYPVRLVCQNPSGHFDIEVEDVDSKAAIEEHDLTCSEEVMIFF